MLVISRTFGEVVWIGGIRVMVSDIRADRVRIAIDAPLDIKIVREELLNDAELAERKAMYHKVQESKDAD